MEVFIEFLINNYLWILIVALILLFALIGYFVDISTSKKAKIKMLAQEVNNDKYVHPAVEAYTNEKFDEPLINDENN